MQKYTEKIICASSFAGHFTYFISSKHVNKQVKTIVLYAFFKSGS